jgi:DNA polymerase-1
VVIVASDKDLLQLVGDGITVLNPSKDLRLDPAGVAKEFGAPPELVRDVLGLMGDAVDNIPGVPGVGEKTALTLVGTYGDVEAIIARAERFVAAFDARDALVTGLETIGSHVVPLQERFVAATRALLELEKDEALAARLRDAADRAAGAPPATPKEAKALAKVLKELDKGSQRRISQAVVEHAASARLSRELATVDRHVPASFDPEALRHDPPDRERLAKLFGSLGFRSLTAEYSAAAAEPGAPAESAAQPPAPAAPAAAYTTILTLDALHAAVTASRAAGRIAVDTETNSTDPMQAKLVGISLSWAPGQGVYIPVAHAYLGVPDQLELDAIQEVLARSWPTSPLRRSDRTSSTTRMSSGATGFRSQAGGWTRWWRRFSWSPIVRRSTWTRWRRSISDTTRSSMRRSSAPEYGSSRSTRSTSTG